MTDRDRLIELIVNADTYDSYECKLCSKDDDACDCCFAEKLADYLLANGVTFKAEAYKECIEKVKEQSNKATWVSGGKLVAYEYTITAKKNLTTS